MAGNKPKFVHVLILGGALGGLAFDKFVLRAEAGTGEAVHAADEADAQVSTTASEKVKIEREPLGERFELAERRLSLPAFRRLDAFSKPAEEIVIQAASEERATRDSGFRSRHRLTAVLSQESGDIAVVDGRLLKIGDTVEGVELVRIVPNAAVFMVGEEEIHLPLDRPGLDR